MTSGGGKTTRTHEYRRGLRAQRPVTRTPLMDLGSWVFHHGHDIAGAPSDLLRGALSFVQARLRAARDRSPSRRLRGQIRWLARWEALIERELSVLN